MTTEEANNFVKDATIAGVVVLGVNILLTAIYSTGAGIAHLDWWNIADLVILAVLTYGIYKRNFWSALLMLIYYVLSVAIVSIESKALMGVPMLLIMGYFFWRGVVGTRYLHQFHAQHS